MAAGLTLLTTPFQRKRRHAESQSPSYRPQVRYSDCTPPPNSASSSLQVKELGSGEDAANWANQNLAVKNRLRPSDAAEVEALFAARLTTIGTSSVQEVHAHMPAGGGPAKLPIEMVLTRVNSAFLSRVAFAIESTSAQSPRNPVSFVVAALRIPIIFVLPKAGLYPAR